MSVPSKQKTNI